MQERYLVFVVIGGLIVFLGIFSAVIKSRLHRHRPAALAVAVDSLIVCASILAHGIILPCR